MNISEFARFFVRFNALIYAFWAVYELTNFPAYYRNFITLHEFAEVDSIAARDFTAYILRVALIVFAAVVLFGKTDKIIELLTKGRWPKEPCALSDPTHDAGS